MEKKHLSIKLSPEAYNLLKSDIGKGRISNFVEELIVRELGSAEKKIEQEYQQFYSNPQNLKEAKQWEQVEIKNWKKFESEKGRNKTKKA